MISFVPPRKPEPLLQELYWPDKWKVLVCCLMLNCTQRKQVDQVVETFFERYPNAEAYVRAYENEITRLEIVNTIRSLGFYNRRAKTIHKFSVDFLSKDWVDARELHGVGEYAGRCYEMLFLGKMGDSPPNDHALNDYWWFYKQNHEGN